VKCQSYHLSLCKVGPTYHCLFNKFFYPPPTHASHLQAVVCLLHMLGDARWRGWIRRDKAHPRDAHGAGSSAGAASSTSGHGGGHDVVAWPARRARQWELGGLDMRPWRRVRWWELCRLDARPWRRAPAPSSQSARYYNRRVASRAPVVVSSTARGWSSACWCVSIEEGVEIKGNRN
jgi:hypothetical protein